MKFNEYRSIIVEIQKLDFGTDNIFKILHQEAYENKHSTFLSWLLNPKANHGLGCSFAEEFFKKVKIRDTKNKGFLDDCKGYNDIDASKINRVRTEVRINGETQKKKGKDKRRIDILIEGEGFTCTIENKFGSKVHGGQCSDYKEYVEEQYKGSNNKFLFLDIEKPDDFDSKEYAGYDFISYSEIIEILNSLDIDSSKIRQADYIRQYIDILEEKYGVNKNNRYIQICEKNSEDLSYEKITEICSISTEDYENLEYEEKRFVDVIKDYYCYRKHNDDKEIKDNLQTISKDKYFIKDDYGKKSTKAAKNSDETEYAYAIPASVEEFDMKKYVANWKKDKSNDNEKINEKINEIKKIKLKKGDKYFKSVDFRAPDMEHNNKSILLLAGFIPSYSKNISNKLEKGSIDLNNLKNLSGEGWETEICFYMKTGAGEGNPIFKVPIAIDCGNPADSADVFKIVFPKGKKISYNAGDIFSDGFWTSLDKMNAYLSCKNKNSIQTFIVNCMIDNNKSINTSLSVIDKIKALPEFDSLKYRECPFAMDYSKVTCLFDDSKKEEIEKGIKNNYEIISFKEWLKSNESASEEFLLKFLCEEMKGDKKGKILKELLKKLNEDKDKKCKYENDITFKKMKEIAENSDKSYQLDLNTIMNEDLKAAIKKALTKEVIYYLVDQREHKELIPAIYIQSIYEINEKTDPRDLKKIFYDETIKITSVYGLGEWFKKNIFLEKEDWAKKET